MPDGTWSREACLTALWRAAEDVDGLLTQEAYVEWSGHPVKPSRRVIRRYWNSWADALEAAGIEAVPMQRRPDTDARDGASWTNPSLLEELYVEEGLTQEEIADRLGCAQPTVSMWLDRHDIE